MVGTPGTTRFTMPETYLDNAQRKKIVMWWIPVCLTVLHVWASILLIATCFGKQAMDGESIRVMFSSCVTGIGCLIVLLISDKALEFVISRLTGSSPVAQTIEKTTTETTVVTPNPQLDTAVKNVDIKANNVNVNTESR